MTLHDLKQHLDDKVTRHELQKVAKDRLTFDEVNKMLKDAGPRHQTTANSSRELEQEVALLRAKIDETIRIVQKNESLDFEDRLSEKANK